MKRIVSVLLCFVLLMTTSVLCLGVSAAPSETATFTLSANDAKVGETVNVVVSISENSYFTNATVYLHYDSAVMEYVSDALGEAAPKSAMYMSNNFADRDYVKMAYVAINGLQKGGELWVFEFKVLSEVASEFTVSFDECIGADDDNNEFELNYTVVPCIVNNKGQVTTTKVTTTKATTTTLKNDETVTTTVSDEDATTTTADETTTVAGDGKTTTTKEATNASTTVKATKTTTTTKAVSDKDTPKTGDNSLALMAVVICVAAMAVVGVTLMVKKIRD